MNLLDKLKRRKKIKLPDSYVQAKFQTTPDCPFCHEPMVLRTPPPDKGWRAFWGCSQFPKCKGSRQIVMETGLPETDEQILTRMVYTRLVRSVLITFDEWDPYDHYGDD